MPRSNNPKPRKYRKKGGCKGGPEIRAYWRIAKREQRAKQKKAKK